MHFSGNFFENVLVVVVGGLVIKLLSIIYEGAKGGIMALARPERMAFPSWTARLERWKEERRRQHFHSDNRAGYKWTLAIAVVMAMFGYYAARQRSNIDYGLVSQRAHQVVQERYQKEINLQRHVRFSREADELIVDEGDGKFTVRGWYSWDAHKSGEKRQRWVCSLHSPDGGRNWDSDSVKKEIQGP